MQFARVYQRIDQRLEQSVILNSRRISHGRTAAKLLGKAVEAIIFFFIAAIGGISVLSAQSSNGSAGNPIAVTANFQAAIGTPWLGFGYNQYPLDRNTAGDLDTWDRSDWSLTRERTNFIRPSVVRIVAYRDWFNPSGTVGDYDWDSAKMKSFYKVLNYYRSKGIPVMTGLWHSNLNGTDDPAFYVSADDPASFQQLQKDFFGHLVRTKGYSNLRFYTPTNEPEGEGISFSQWSTAIQNTFFGFQDSRLPTSVLTGADSWGSWTPWAAQWNSSDLSNYDYHYYLNSGSQEVTGGSLQTNLSNILTSIKGHDASPKPILISECGFTSSSDGAVDYWYKLNPVPALNPTTPLYGLYALDYGIQAANSGASSAMAWSLDGFDYGKDSGMWQITGIDGGTALRPWYYTWSLLCRYFRDGGTVFPVASSQSGLHGVGVEQKAYGNKANWSIAMVNQTGTDMAVNLNANGWGGGTFSLFTYTTSNYGDGISLSLPATDFWVAEMQSGFTVTVPANGGIVLTSIDHEPIPRATRVPLETTPIS